MPVLDGVKFACKQCIIGHRTGKCTHDDGRELFPIRSRGRPKSQCETCQEKRRTSSWHEKCECNAKAAEAGAGDTASILQAAAASAAAAAAEVTAPDGGEGGIAAPIPCACHTTNVCTCCNGPSRSSVTHQAGMAILQALGLPSTSSSAASAASPSIPSSAGAASSSTSSPCCRDPNCICGSDPDAQRRCCAYNGPSELPAVIAARQRGYKISTGPQPRRMRKDRLRDEEKGINYRAGSGPSSSAAAAVAAWPRYVAVAQQAGHAAAAIQFFAGPSGSTTASSSTSLPQPPAPAPAEAPSPFPLSNDTFPGTHLQPSSIPSTSAYDPSPPPPFSSDNAGWEWNRQSSSTPSSSSYSSTSSTLHPPPPLPAPTINPSSTALSIDKDPSLDALLEAINVVRQGPASIQCSCKGTCRCRSCAGRPRTDGGAPEAEGQSSCCGSSKQTQKQGQNGQATGRKRSGEEGDEEGRPAAKRVKRNLGSSSTSVSTSGSSHPQDDDDDDDDEGEQTSDDCASCGACDLDFKLPSGIPEVDEFGAAPLRAGRARP
ncbi:hypothetical protein CF326_g419 [Tilletia indica]|nr:hypothetical protein CF326_g419 [Tilletia indica]